MPQHEIPEDEELIEVRLYGGHPFAMVPKWVTALIAEGVISHGAFATFVVLLGYADNNTGQAFPGKKTLCAAVGRTDRVVTGYLRELEAARVLGVQRRPRPGARNLPNLYHLAVMGPLPPVENLPAEAAEDAAQGVGAEYSPQGVPAADSPHLGAADSGGTRFTNELEEKEMPIRAAARPRAEAEPVENPPLTKRDRDATAEDFESWWTAYRAASDRSPGAKRPAQRAYALARREHGAAELLALLDGYAAGHARQRSTSGFVASFPDAVRWLRDHRWQDYALSDAQRPADGSGASEPSAGAVARVEALRGPYSPPELPAELSPEDYRARVVADRADWLTGGGRWENVTA